MLQSVELDTFSGHVGEVFRLHTAMSQSLEVQLIEAKSLGRAPEKGMREPFSIVFRGPNEPVLTQATYTLEHDEIGSYDIFLVPIGLDKENSGMRYEAVFT